MARDIKEKIEDTLQYPGTIKVVVIRETRAEETAKQVYMTEKELNFFASEIMFKNENINIFNKIITEEYQYLLGQYKDYYFSFGIFKNVDYKENRFFVEIYNAKYKAFLELVETLSYILEEKPTHFIEKNDGQFMYLWLNINEKNNFKFAEKVKENEKELVKTMFYSTLPHVKTTH